MLLLLNIIANRLTFVLESVPLYNQKVVIRTDSVIQVENLSKTYEDLVAVDGVSFAVILPYAIVFGVAEKFAKAFEKMGIEPQQPSWYVGSRPFNAVVFGGSMSSFSSSIGTAMAATPGGSSFSGGGFGGGGGGSW